MSEQILQLYVNVYLPRTVQICSRLRFVLIVFVILDRLVNDWFFTKSSVGITKMLMGAGVRERSERKKIFRPLLGGGAEKVDCLVVTNNTNCFMLFIVKCDKIISAASILWYGSYVVQ